jgi:hypothetical protein
MTNASPQQLALPALPYGGEVPHVTGSETSAAAAKAIEPKLGNLQRQVLLALDMFGPLSDEALDRVCHATKPLRPRRVELTRVGLITDSGDRIKAESGLLVALWTLTAAGEAKALELKEASDHE